MTFSRLRQQGLEHRPLSQRTACSDTRTQFHVQQCTSVDSVRQARLLHFILYACACVRVHVCMQGGGCAPPHTCVHVQVRGQHGGVISFLLQCGSQESTWVGGLGSRGLFTRRHLSSDNCHSCQKAMLMCSGLKLPASLVTTLCELPRPYVLSSFDTGLL